MIAPISPTEAPAPRPRRPHPVRRLVGSLLLPRPTSGRTAPPPIAAWKAWLLIGWATAVVVVYLVKMLHLG